MTTDRESVHSRRAVIAAALGAGVATVATALSQPGSANATDGDAVQVGSSYTGTSLTSISSEAGDAIMGSSGSATGLAGISTTGVGIYARSKSISGDTAFQGKIGLRAQSFHDTGAIGVLAESFNGQAVHGVDLGSGTGGYFTSSTGTALQVAGKAKFSRSGLATVPKGTLSVTITVPGGVTARSVVHATLQTYRAGVAVAAVRINYPSAGKARIYLTKVASTTAGTTVGWFVAEH